MAGLIRGYSAATARSAVTALLLRCSVPMHTRRVPEVELHSFWQDGGAVYLAEKSTFIGKPCTFSGNMARKVSEVAWPILANDFVIRLVCAEWRSSCWVFCEREVQQLHI